MIYLLTQDLKRDENRVHHLSYFRWDLQSGVGLGVLDSNTMECTVSHEMFTLIQKLELYPSNVTYIGGCIVKLGYTL